MRITIKISKGVIISIIVHGANFAFITVFKPPTIDILFVKNTLMYINLLQNNVCTK